MSPKIGVREGGGGALRWSFVPLFGRTCRWSGLGNTTNGFLPVKLWMKSVVDDGTLRVWYHVSQQLCHRHVRRQEERETKSSWWTSKFYLYSVELCDVFIKWYNKINWLGGSSQKLGIFPLARGKTTYGLFGQDAREQPAQTQCNRVEGVDCFNSVI